MFVVRFWMQAATPVGRAARNADRPVPATKRRYRTGIGLVGHANALGLVTDDGPANRWYVVRNLTKLIAETAIHGANIGIYADRRLDDQRLGP